MALAAKDDHSAATSHNFLLLFGGMEVPYRTLANYVQGAELVLFQGQGQFFACHVLQWHL